MTVQGTANGKSIELDEPLPFPDGEPLTIDVHPTNNDARNYPTPAEVVEALRKLPPVTDEDIAELMRAIDSDKQPASDRGIFDELPDNE